MGKARPLCKLNLRAASEITYQKRAADDFDGYDQFEMRWSGASQINRMADDEGWALLLHGMAQAVLLTACRRLAAL
jgi:hypothetical protein